MICEITNKKAPTRFFIHNNKHFAKKYYKDVIMDIENNSNIKIKVKDFRKSFILYASLERVDFLPDIEDELICYFDRKRMYHTNIDEWYKIRKSIFKRDNYTCKYCGVVGGRLEADHIIPFSKGGGNDLKNLTTSCIKCNRQKKNKSVKEFNIWRKNQ